MFAWLLSLALAQSDQTCPCAEPDPEREPISTVGTLPSEAIRETMKVDNRLRFCWQRASLKVPMPSRIVAKFTIDERGCARDVRVRATPHNPEVEACTTSWVDAKHFPEPDGGPVIVQYPWNINPG